MDMMTKSKIRITAKSNPQIYLNIAAFLPVFSSQIAALEGSSFVKHCCRASGPENRPRRFSPGPKTKPRGWYPERSAKDENQL
jgi:hypothetical protein